MDEQEFRRQRMLSEYGTLRAEVLQCYEQQANLVFGATITAVAALAITLSQSPAVLLGLPTLLIILIGVSNKSIANYRRLYRIVSYIAVVHEQGGKPREAFRPSLLTPAWHSRWRLASRSGAMSPTGGTGAKAEAWFLLLLGLAGWVLIGGSSGERFLADQSSVAILTLSVGLTAAFVYYWYQLFGIYKVLTQYENGFRLLLQDEADHGEPSRQDKR